MTDNNSLIKGGNIKLPIVLLRESLILFPYAELELKFSSEKGLKEIIINAINKEKDRNNISDEKYYCDISKIIVLPNYDNLGGKIENYTEEVAVLADINFGKFFLLDSDSNSNLLGNFSLRGIKRVKITNISKNLGYYESNFVFLEDVPVKDKKDEIYLKEKLYSCIEKSIKFESKNNSFFGEKFFSFISGFNLESNNLSVLVDFFSFYSSLIDLKDKYKILCSLDLSERINFLIECINEKVEKKEKNKKIRDDNKKKENKIENDNDDIIERIKEFMGSSDKFSRGRKRKNKAYLDKLKNGKYPSEVKKVIEEKIKNAPDEYSPGDSGIEQYVNLVLDLPWWQRTDDKEDIDYAKYCLNSHYGLEDVKKRIIEYLVAKSVAKRGEGKLFGQIICLVGPPGTGKTSIAYSIAKAIGRNFVKISLAGINDVGEIKGHRITYVGAEPGLIIKRMKDANVVNPLFLINEIDKVSVDYRGSSVINSLLEVLDPEQNKYFHDNYLEIPYDLSEVMFVCTANTLNNLSRELIDRMEIIEVSSYTEEQKIKIAKDYLIPDINDKEYGLSEFNKLFFSDDAIRKIIRNYTREAGVRELKRKIHSVFRKIFVEQEEKKEIKVDKNIDESKLKMYLKKEIYEFTEKNIKSKPGICTGLAYTGQGGDILPIEVVNYDLSFLNKRGGEIDLTGNLGDIIKESARIALGYIKSNYERFKIDKNILFNSGIHIHFPAGAIPKDGPSAGIALTSAIISSLTRKSIDNETGMTGEITLLGNVEAIGGLREKSIAAERAKLKRIIIPKGNEKDIDEIPEEVKKNLDIRLVDNYEQVFDIIFGD